MKTVFIKCVVIFTSFISYTVCAQAYNYTWMKGSATTSLASYGTIGVASVSNCPGGQMNGITWTDQSGNLWLYGGQGNTNTSYGYLNDLWKYSPATNNWTWVNGSGLGAQAPAYGTLGVPSVTNNPGGRQYSAAWADGSGNLWLFGGLVNMNAYNDLWRYSIVANQWTWMGGSNTASQTAVYGTISVPYATNIPGASWNFVSWKDAAGNFWLYDAVDGTEIWKYNPSSTQWAWMSGTNTGTVLAVYGTMGVSSASIHPGERLTEGVGDAAGNLYVFGGKDYTSASYTGRKNDVWKYDVSNNQWTWIGGTQSSSPAGTYGTQGVFASANVPPGRYGHVVWMDAGNKLWLFGGEFPTLSAYYQLNDTWCFDINTGQWAWMKGSNVPAGTSVYGAQTIPAVGNTPDARPFSTYWQNDPATLWIFSGSTWLSPNDLWRFNGCTSSSVITISSSHTLLCPGSTATLTANGSGPFTWNTGALTNTLSVSPSITTIYSASSNGTANCYTAAEFTIPVQSISIVLQNPANPLCSGRTYMLLASTASSYTWSTGHNSSAITVVPASSTLYSVSGTSNSCIMTATYALNVIQTPSMSVSSSTNVICSGQIASLTATGSSGTYLWSSGQTGSVITIAPPATTSYTIYGSASGCSASAVYQQSVNPLPVLSISTSSSLTCSGDPVVISISGAGSYSWSSGQSAASFTASPLFTTIYTATGTTNGCSVTGTVAQQVLPLPTLSVSGAANVICPGGTVTLSVSGASTYAWNVQGLTTPVIQLNPLLTTTYVVTGTDNNGCEGSAAVTVSVLSCVGMQQLTGQKAGFSVYPNPASDIFTIGDAAGKKLKIINSLGQIVLEQTLESETVIIDCCLPSGVYYCTISGMEKTVKLVIQE